MEDCCAIEGGPITFDIESNCPECSQKGKTIGIITLKSLLVPEALTKLKVDTNYRMCLNKDCQVVYFNDKDDIYRTQDLKVPVLAKNDSLDCLVCYCFGWTREKLNIDYEQKKKSTAVSEISDHIKAGRCGCEVNNPEGSCCLGNVKLYLTSLTKI